MVKKLIDFVGTDMREMAAAKAAEHPRRTVAARTTRAKARPAAHAPTAAEEIPFEENTGTYGGFSRSHPIQTRATS